MIRDLADRVVVVTGAGRGKRELYAGEPAAAGARIAPADVRPVIKAVEQEAAGLGMVDRLLAMHADVGTRELTRTPLGTLLPAALDEDGGVTFAEDEVGARVIVGLS